MKRFNKKDIENMLSNTEKTEPVFNKNVDFPSYKQMPMRRRRIIIPIVACLVIFTASISIILSVRDNTPPNVVPPATSIGTSDNFSYTSNVSKPISVSDSVSDYSYDISDNSDVVDVSGGVHFPSVSYDESGSSTPDNEVYLKVEYPSNGKHFEESVLKNGQSIEEYLASNYVKYLEAKLKLPIYQRSAISDTMKTIILDMISYGFSLELVVDENSMNTGEVFEALDLSGNSLEISDYGDWTLHIAENVLTISNKENDIDYYKACVASFISEHGSVFGTKPLEYTAKVNGLGLVVEVFENDKDNGYISEYPLCVFAFNASDTEYFLTSITHYSHNAEVFGDLKTRTYDNATKALFANKYYSANSFEFSDEDSFVFLGYDVRYVVSKYEALICPYYAFVVRVQHSDDSFSVQTLFVPAIDERHLMD